MYVHSYRYSSVMFSVSANIRVFIEGIFAARNLRLHRLLSKPFKQDVDFWKLGNACFFLFVFAVTDLFFAHERLTQGSSLFFSPQKTTLGSLKFGAYESINNPPNLTSSSMSNGVLTDTHRVQVPRDQSKHNLCNRTLTEWQFLTSNPVKPI